MRLYNSLSRKKETFQPRPSEMVNLFVCGPTVYDQAHIGHARTYLCYDALVKFLRQRLSWKVFYLQNITNIDDKIIERAKEQNQDPLVLAKHFEDLYYQDMQTLGIDSVNEYARATDYIGEIIRQVERLIKKGHAYKIEGEGYYFDVTTFKDYGKLSGRTVEAAEDAVTRIDESVNKRNRADFALWKFSLQEEPSWESSLGRGRPGWHIEDTAITEKHFGFIYHLHGGAIDLKFPHHEAEITQMESLSGIKPMVKIWVHIGVLTIEGRKMAKSLGNFITIRDFLASASSEVLRFLVFSSHYRSPLDYSENILKEARARLERLFNFSLKLKAVSDTAPSFPYQEFTKAFWKELEDDFNTPKALARLFELMGQANKFIDTHTLSQKDSQGLLDFLGEVNDIFNIIPSETSLPEKIIKLVKDREQARQQSDFKQADKLRRQIDNDGYKLEDTDHGPRIYKI